MLHRVLGFRRAFSGSRANALLLVLLSGCTEATAPLRQPAAVATIEVAASRPTLSIGDSVDMVAVLRDAKGAVLNERVVQWSTSAPNVATVTQSGRVVAVANGTTTISARSDEQEGRALVTVATPPIEIISVAPSPLIAGETAEIRGRGFNPRAGAISVLVDSTTTVLGTVTESTIAFTVPCTAPGNLSLTVRSRGTEARQLPASVQTRQLALAVGDVTVLPTVRQAGCTMLSANAVPSSYLLTVFSTAASPSTVSAFDWVGMRGAPTALRPDGLAGIADEAGRDGMAHVTRDVIHDAHLQRERSHAATWSPVPHAATQALRRAPAVLEQNALKRFYFTFGGSCNDTSRVFTARAVAVGRRIAIWEDTANTVRADGNAELGQWYTRLLRIADDEQLPMVQRLVGDPLARDALTDADGLVHLVFSQRVNATGAGAYVSSCDLRPRQAGLGSNTGEIMYGVAPTTTVSNPESAESPDGWFSFMARTVVHELKHIASYTSRVTRQASFEEVWLEEGTARMAEEAWAREYLYKRPPRSNTGFGSSTDGGIYCDFHPSSATCTANDPLRRPSYGMRRHFNDIRNKLVQPWNWSPFGDAPGQSGAVFYNSAWSLLRHAADQCCSSDSAFLTALNNTNRLGLDNLSQASGHTVERLLGTWGMALLVDDRSELQGKAPMAQFLSWNLREIYAGLHSAPAWQGRWTTPYPVVATVLTADPLGTSTLAGPVVRGGGHAFFELPVAAGQAQLLHLRGPSGSALSENLSLGILRVR